jgi:hypothetical protein
MDPWCIAASTPPTFSVEPELASTMADPTRVCTLTQREGRERYRGRVTANAPKLQFDMDDDQLAVLKDELL